MNRYVLDASALMTFFEDGPGADRVEEPFLKADKLSGRCRCSIGYS